jgi:hypothetical protein
VVFVTVVVVPVTVVVVSVTVVVVSVTVVVVSVTVVVVSVTVVVVSVTVVVVSVTVVVVSVTVVVVSVTVVVVSVTVVVVSVTVVVVSVTVVVVSVTVVVVPVAVVDGASVGSEQVPHVTGHESWISPAKMPVSNRKQLTPVQLASSATPLQNFVFSICVLVTTIVTVVLACVPVKLVDGFVIGTLVVAASVFSAVVSMQVPQAAGQIRRARTARESVSGNLHRNTSPSQPLASGLPLHDLGTSIVVETFVGDVVVAGALV